MNACGLVLFTINRMRWPLSGLGIATRATIFTVGLPDWDPWKDSPIVFLSG